MSFSDPASNLACDESLIEFLEYSKSDDGVLRLWEPSDYFVVLGHANKILSEVDTGACEHHGIPIFRRFSGGGTVLQGPGCLNYSLILSNGCDALDTIRESYRFVLGRHQQCIEELLGAPVEIQGISDLAVHGRKFSGNAQNRKRHFVLIHGTFLLDFDLALIERCLRMPSKQPEYRRSRTHGDFLRNLHLEGRDVRNKLKEKWKVTNEFGDVPLARVNELVREKYGRGDWTYRF